MKAASTGPYSVINWRLSGGRERSYDVRLRIALAIGAVLYLAAVSVQLILHGGWPTPDFLIPPLLLLAVAAKRGWSFLIDWLPLLALVMVYEGFRGLADNLNHRVHYLSLIRGDEWFFGAGNSGPGVLQSWLYHAGKVAWYDWVACAAYSAHYVLPVILGFALWLKSRKLYWRFATSFLVLFLAGFLSFYLYPAAPPWMASEQSLISPIQRVLVDTLSTLPATQPFALAYQRFSPNLVAAMPSLHAASPMLLSLIAVRVWGKKAAPTLVYPFIGGLAWVYMGEHYFVDVLIGWLYGIAAFVAVWGITFPRVSLVLESVARRLAPAGLGAGRAVPSWPLAAVAVLAMAYVWVDPLVRPPYQGPIWVTAPVATGEETTAADVAAPTNPTPLALTAVPCGEIPAASPIDGWLAAITPQYAAYVVGQNGGACLALTAQGAIPPPDDYELEELESDDLSTPRILSLAGDEDGRLTVARAGVPSQGLAELAGLDPSALYFVVIRSGPTDHADEVLEVARTVGEALLGP